jgi:hypothetical protein
VERGGAGREGDRPRDGDRVARRPRPGRVRLVARVGGPACSCRASSAWSPARCR